MTASEKLQAWITETGRLKGWVARQVGVTPDAVTAWLKGTYRPDGDARVRLERLTDGAVTAADWVL